MLKDVLDFISRNPLLVFLFALMTVSWTFGLINRSADRRHQRKMAREDYERKIEILTRREAIAARVGGAVELLMVDRVLAEDFDTRLRIAIDVSKKPLQPATPAAQDQTESTKAAQAVTAQS